MTDNQINIPFGIYKHYKGNHYYVLGCAINENTQEKMVLYRGFYDSPDKLAWIRPAKQFIEQVKNEKGETVQRFTKLNKKV